MIEPHYADSTATVYAGDCLDVLRQLPAGSVDAVCTDPPYGLEFMGSEWDSFRPSSARLRTRVDGRTNPREGKSTVTTPEAYVAGSPFQAWCQLWAVECLRVLKPGGYLLAFGGTRTYHRLAAGVEDAGFEIRDSITWLYGSGFPKSLDVSKAIDAAAGAVREIVGANPLAGKQTAKSGTAVFGEFGEFGGVGPVTALATDAAREWAGWGTALKPASEPIVVARKPFPGTVAANVTEHGTGAINIDGCRVKPDETGSPDPGRFPANVVLSHAPECGPGPDTVCVPGCPVRALDDQTGPLSSGANPVRRLADKFRDAYGDFAGQEECTPARGADTGSASRFFPVFRYQPKADQGERPEAGGVRHPTVKPVDLMRWLVRLVTRPGGVVLDPFAGSGTTGEACRLEGFTSILVEREPGYLPLIVQRLQKRADPVAHLESRGEDLGLFGFIE